MTLVTVEDIRAAAERVRDLVVTTPLVPCRWADPERPLWLKPESLQPIGAFKIRGAANAIAALPDERRAYGVVAHSSGNHAQAVALAAARFGVPAWIVMPDSAPPVKVEATRELGAEVVLVPVAEREIEAQALVDKHGANLIPPYDHPDVIAGQGTVGLEIVEAAAARGIPLDAVLVPISGGGLISGVATAVKTLSPTTKVVGVEPELAAHAADSLRTGELVGWTTEDSNRTIADGLRIPRLGDLPWEHVRAYVDDIVTVSEDEIVEAVGVLGFRGRLVAEPSGAVTTAAYLFRSSQLPGGSHVAVLSGGNVDPVWYARILGERAAVGHSKA